MKKNGKLTQSTPKYRAEAKRDAMSGAGARRDKKLKKAENKATQWRTK